MATQYKKFIVSPKWGTGAPWQDTQVDVTNGQRLTISASGRVSPYSAKPDPIQFPNWPEWFGPDGIMTNLFPNCGKVDTTNTLPIMMLLGKIGSGPIFRVGRNFDGTANAAGRLYLTVNDCNSQSLFNDNRGNFKVRIVVDPPGAPKHKVPCPAAHDAAAKPTSYNPIELYDGNKVLGFTDLELVTPAGKLTFERGYDQSKQADGNYQFMGLGWSHNHALKLVISGTAAQVFFPNGGVLKLDGTGHFVAQAGSNAVLDVSGSNYVLTAEDQSQYVFEPSWVSGTYRLLNRKWPSGEQWTYSYLNNQLDVINDGYNRKLKFVYRPSGAFDAGQLWRVGDHTAEATISNTTPSGRYIEFGYSKEQLGGSDYGTSPKALLTTFKDVRGKDWAYEYYGAAGTETDPAKRSFLQKRISPQVDTNGDGTDDAQLTLEELAYTLSSGVISSITQKRGNALLDSNLAFEKDTNIGKNQTTESINNLDVGFVKTHFFANGVYLGMGVNDADNSPFDIQVLDQNYRPMGQVDGAGNDTQLVWSPSNIDASPGKLLTKVTDAAGKDTLFAYNSDDTLKVSTDAEGRKTLYVYDTNRRSPTLILVANSAVEMAINGDMETSSGWSTLLGATTSLVTTPVDSGVNARQVTANALNSGIESVGVNLQAAYTYVISARVRPAAGQVKMQLVNGAAVLASTLSDTTKMNAWQTLRLVYTSASAITGAKVQFLANVASSSFYVDSLHLLETSNFQRWQEFIYDSKLRPLFERVITPATAAVQQETERVYGTGVNDAGLVQQLIQRDPLVVSNNSTYTYIYDTAGRLVTTQKISIFSDCEFSHTVYDPAGLVLATVCGPTGTTPTTVQAARDMYTTNNLNKVTTYDYDSMGRRVAVNINDGTGSLDKQTTLTVYDALDRVSRTIANYTNVASQYTAPASWAWDASAKVWKDGNGQTISHGTNPTDGSLNTRNVISLTEYNKIGAVRQQTDVLGNVTLFGYDSAGRVIKTIRNASITAYNNEYAGTSPNTADPDLSDYVVSTAPDQDIISETVYDANGNPVKTIDPSGSVTYTIYDALKRPVKTIRNAKASARIDLYDNDSLYIKGNDPTSPLYIPSAAADEDQIERTEYDAMGRVVRQIDTLGKVSYTAYDDQGRVSKTIRNYVPQAASLVTTNPKDWFWYEDAGGTMRWQLSSTNTTAIGHGAANDQNIISYTRYDAEGRVLYTQDPLGRRTWTKYDGLGRVVKTIANAVALPTVTLGSVADPRSDSYVPSGASDKDRITITFYDAQGRVKWTQDPNGRKNWNVYDSQGRVIKTVANCTYVSGSPAPEDAGYVGSSNPDDDIISSTEYDLLGRVTKTIDSLGRATTFGYDSVGRRTKTITNYVDGVFDTNFPDIDLIQTTEYDMAGRVVKTTDARNTQTMFSYDQAGRRLAVTRAANSPLARTDYTVYDKTGRTLRSIAGYTPLYLQNGALVYQPNAAFSSTVIAPHAKTNGVWDFVPPHNGEGNDRNLISEFIYDKAGRQVSIIDPVGNTTQTVYFKDGATESTVDPEGTVTKYRYDGLRRRTRVVQGYSPVQITPKIAFAAIPSTVPQIHTMNVDGTLRTNLSNNSFSEDLPSWSPDGSKIAYRSNRLGGTYPNLHTMKPDGTLLLRLTTLPNFVQHPAWSPDGQRIAFSYFASGLRPYVMNADGSNPQPLSNIPIQTGLLEGRISWSPDGQRLVMSVDGGALYIARLDGSEVVDLKVNGITPSWSPDGSRIAYVTSASADVFVINADGSSPIQLTNIPIKNPGNGLYPTWSPDGTQLAFYSNRDGDNELFLINADGSGGLVKLTTNTIVDTDPHWSPQTIDPMFWVWNNNQWQYGNANVVAHGSNNDQNIIVDVTYDRVGRVINQRGPNGSLTAFDYDKLDRRISLTNPLNKVWSTVYTDLAGGRTRADMTNPGITGAANYHVLREFDRSGRLSSIKYGDALTTPAVSMTYDKAGNRLKVSEFNNDNLTGRIRETTFGYDTARRLNSVAFDNNGDGTADETVTYKYDAGGLRTRMTLPGSLNVDYTYDQRGQLVSLTDWDSQKTQLAYDQIGRHVFTERANGLRSRYQYDAGGRLRVLRHTREGRIRYKFPNLGYLDLFNRANGALGSSWSGTTAGYSILSNQVDVGTGGDIYWAGSSFGADQEAFVTLSIIDAASTEIDLLLKAQSALWSNGVIKVMYKPSTGKVQVWTYESTPGWVQRGADITVTFAAGDQFGARALADGAVEVYKNQVLLGICDTGNWSFKANGGSIGLWLIGSSNSVLDNFGGGTFSAPAKVSTTAAHFEYQVDKRGNRTQAFEAIANPATISNTGIGYNDKSLVLNGSWATVGSFKESSQIAASLKLAFLGDEATLTMGTGPDHGIYDIYIDGSLWQSFDGYAASAGQTSILISAGVDSLRLQSEGPHVLEIRIRSEKNKTSSGNKVRFSQLVVSSRTWTMQTVKYSYDKLSRLLEARHAPGVNAGAVDADLLRRYLYTYDRAGNRLSESLAINGAAPTVVSRTYNAANQISSAGYTYDNNGNLTNDGTNAYTWDRANRMTNVGGVGGYGYVYDGLGNRVKQTGYDINFLLDLQPGLAVVLRDNYPSLSANRYYVHGPRGLMAEKYQTAPWQWEVQDGLGSIRAHVDFVSSDTVVDNRSYSPYGEAYDDAGYGSWYGFTGEWQATNYKLLHLRARNYNTAMGAFTSLDPFEGVSCRAMSLNGYSWVEGNVPNAVDPSGMITSFTTAIKLNTGLCNNSNLNLGYPYLAFQDDPCRFCNGLEYTFCNAHITGPCAGPTPTPTLMPLPPTFTPMPASTPTPTPASACEPFSISSATPDLQVAWNTTIDRLSLLTSGEKIGGYTLPSGKQVVDMLKTDSIGVYIISNTCPTPVVCGSSTAVGCWEEAKNRIVLTEKSVTPPNPPWYDGVLVMHELTHAFQTKNCPTIFSGSSSILHEMLAIYASRIFDPARDDYGIFAAGLNPFNYLDQEIFKTLVPNYATFPNVPRDYDVNHASCVGLPAITYPTPTPTP